MKSGLELDPASVFSMEIDTDKENDRVRAEEKSKSADKKEMKSNSSNSIDDTPDDEYPEKGDEKSAELESVGNTKVRGGEQMVKLVRRHN